MTLDQFQMNKTLDLAVIQGHLPPSGVVQVEGSCWPGPGPCARLPSLAHQNDKVTLSE